MTLCDCCQDVTKNGAVVEAGLFSTHLEGDEIVGPYRVEETFKIDLCHDCRKYLHSRLAQVVVEMRNTTKGTQTAVQVESQRKV